jgi:hypothetical protein
VGGYGKRWLTKRMRMAQESVGKGDQPPEAEAATAPAARRVSRS